MESFVNQPFLDKRRKWASWASYAGLAALFAGILTATRSLLISYLCLMLGVIAASIGAYLSNRYVREPRGDQVLTRTLEGLDKRYALYSYYLSTAHVIASHFGLMVVATRPQKGQVGFADGKWQHRARWRFVTQFLGEPSIGRPELTVRDDVESLEQWVASALPGEEHVPVNGLVLFTNPDVELDAADAPIKALKTNDLAAYLRTGLKGQPVLSTSRQKELRRLLDGVVEASAAEAQTKGKRKA